MSGFLNNLAIKVYIKKKNKSHCKILTIKTVLIINSSETSNSLI